MVLRMNDFLDYGDPAAMRQRIPELEAEVERLREELDDKRLSRYEPAYVGELEREVKGLRDANISIRRDLQTSWEEKARLREENESYRVAFEEELECCKERGEQIERLRERGDWAVEQLRLAEAAGEELREQLSLNRVHDRDCVAREDRLRRIEEAAKALLLTTPGSRERWRKEMDLRAALADPPTDASIGWGHSDGQTS